MTPGWEGVLKHGVYHFHKKLGVDESVMWGDFFFLEAVGQGPAASVNPRPSEMGAERGSGDQMPASYRFAGNMVRLSSHCSRLREPVAPQPTSLRAERTDTMRPDWASEDEGEGEDRAPRPPLAGKRPSDRRPDEDDDFDDDDEDDDDESEDDEPLELESTASRAPC